jgi:hypothetical protein
VRFHLTLGIPPDPILVLFFGAKKRTKRSIHPLQGLPLYGEDAIDSGQEPPSIKDFL